MGGLGGGGGGGGNAAVINTFTQTMGQMLKTVLARSGVGFTPHQLVHKSRRQLFSVFSVKIYDKPSTTSPAPNCRQTNLATSW